jgi:hypothetical protein
MALSGAKCLAVVSHMGLTHLPGAPSVRMFAGKREAHTCGPLVALYGDAEAQLPPVRVMCVTPAVCSGVWLPTAYSWLEPESMGRCVTLLLVGKVLLLWVTTGQAVKRRLRTNCTHSPDEQSLPQTSQALLAPALFLRWHAEHLLNCLHHSLWCNRCGM